MRVARLLTTLATATALRTTRRALAAGALTTALPRPAFAADEWRLGVLKDYSVTKKQASSVRIRPETMLTATGENDTELKLLKVPLGRAAAASFAPEDQLVLAKYFSSRTDADKIGPAKVAAIMKVSLQKQTDQVAGDKTQSLALPAKLPDTPKFVALAQGHDILPTQNHHLYQQP